MPLKLILILFVVGVELLCVAAVAWGLWALLKRFGRIQFSLRTLMIGVTMVAIALSSVATWQYLNTARIEWLAPSSTAARQLTTKPVVIRQDDGFSATYTSKFRPVDKLLEAEIEQPQSDRDTWSCLKMHHELHAITVESSEKAYVTQTLSAFEEIDVLAPGWFVVRGVVQDGWGRPVANARVYILGPLSVFPVGTSETRLDGTFTLPLQARPGRGYFIRVKYGKNEPMNTAEFTLTDDNRELVAKIRVK